MHRQIYRSIGLLILVINFTGICTSQPEDLNPQREVYIQFGFSLNTLKESRMSALKHRNGSPVVGLGFNKTALKSRTTFLMDIAWKSDRNYQDLLDLDFTRFNVKYGHERRIGSQYIGGYVNFPTSLIFPRARTGHFENTPISYLMGLHVGPKWTKSYQVKDELLLTSSVEMTLLGYIIRPSYGHPYPDQFLQDEVFTPTRDGMAGPLLKSGKVLTIKNLRAFNIVIGLHYHIGDSIKVSTSYVLDYFRVRGAKSISSATHDFRVSLGYTY